MYLNLRNREKNGIVDPGADATETVDEIRRRLLSLRDPVNGRLVAAAVYRRADVYSGEAMASAPDLVVGWSAGYRTSWQSALGEISGEMIEDNYDEWRGDHCIAADLVPGVVFSNRVVRLPNPRLEELTTTLLTEFGIQSEPGMKGRSISSVLGPVKGPARLPATARFAGLQIAELPNGFFRFVVLLQFPVNDPQQIPGLR